MEYVNEKVLELKKRYKRSLYGYVAISSTLFILTACLAVFNLYAIRFNPGKDDESQTTERWIFLAITILTAITAMITSITTFFTFKKKAKIYSKKKRRIKNELENFKLGVDDYASGNAEKLLIDKITNISLE